MKKKMTTRLPLIIDISSKPRRIFMVDGIGALLTAFILLTVLVWFQDTFGMSRTILYFLSSVAFIYAIYSFCCYVFIFSNWAPFLKAIVIANVSYCCLTIGLVFYFYDHLTILGLIYFSLEIMVIIGLVLVELAVLSRQSTLTAEGVENNSVL